MEICCEVRPDALPRDSICLTTSMPWVTRPNTTCLPSSQGVSAVVRKNCKPRGVYTGTNRQVSYIQDNPQNA
jgi:hypothetical protein